MDRYGADLSFVLSPFDARENDKSVLYRSERACRLSWLWFAKWMFVAKSVVI